MDIRLVGREFHDIRYFNAPAGCPKDFPRTSLACNLCCREVAAATSGRAISDMLASRAKALSRFHPGCSRTCPSLYQDAYTLSIYPSAHSALHAEAAAKSTI